MPKFSIIIPTWERVNDGKLRRCLDSIQTQTYDDFECIVVDDGSKEDVAGLVSLYDVNFRCIRIPHQGRVIARNTGFAAARGEWFCWCDSDDAYDPMYLATFDYHIQQAPDARLFVCGALVHGVCKDENGKHLVPVWSKLRNAWDPPLDPGEPVHAPFMSGKVSSGEFVYHRECYEKIGPFPPWINPMQIAGGIDDWLGYTTGYSAKRREDGGRWVGNPFGEDFTYLRKLSMFYRIHIIKAALYIHYIR